MNILQTEFIGSFPQLALCPKSPLPEFAFVGRSNVGKSSLINFLTAKKNLAKTSQTPGKTRLMNFFLINDQWRIVDLPGYGYAKVAKSDREIFFKMIKNYLLQRHYLHTIFLLIDARIPPQKIDLEFTDWLGENQLPFVIAFTKTDKVKKTYVTEFLKLLTEKWDPLPQIFYTSAEAKKGGAEILSYIENQITQMPSIPS